MAVKILSGHFKGHNIATPKDIATRPTAVLARKMLFDMLLSNKKWGGDLSKASIIDICAGAGVLGFEALSRGAEKLLLIESSTPAINSIKNNIESLGVKAKTTLLTQKIPKAFHAIPKEFITSDIIFADPPYHRHDLQTDIFKYIATIPLLSKDGFFILQTDPTFKLTCPLGFKVVDDRSSGNGLFWFLQLS
ncbi:MAG: RsmD family RNA methyltransferase [Alphaproteobacteria bacterium]